HTHTHTHTHTHRHLASPNLFLRARRSYANLRKHKGYSYLWCYVFRTLSRIDIRENKERFYLQNLHENRTANTPIPVNINSHSADRPHVGTDPVSVRRPLDLIHAQSLESYLDNMFVPSVKRMGRTDTGSVPTCGLAPESPLTPHTPLPRR
ncbi:hypothetical protein HMPREF9140_00368, partial [Prevotella micans F0438]